MKTKLTFFVAQFFLLFAVNQVALASPYSISFEEPDSKMHKNTVVDSVCKSYSYVSESFSLEPYLPDIRNIWIYLPPNYYEDTLKRFPVLYMHDGQNVFEQGAFGSWKAHEAFNELSAHGGQMGIVVAINNGRERMSEYAPFPNEKHAPQAAGDLYLQAIVNIIMPYVNENFRTLTDATNTGIAGSSLGGLISFYAGVKYPEVFGKIGAISPSFWYCYDDLKPYFNAWQGGDASLRSRIYFICGDDEGETTVPYMQEFYDMARSKGFDPANLRFEVVAGGKHNEASWAVQIGRIYEFLFP